MERLSRIASALAAHGQHELAREVSDVSLRIKQATLDSEVFADLLKSDGIAHAVKYNAKTQAGTAYVSGVGTIEFQESNNDPAVWVSIPSFKFKTTAEHAVTVIEGIRNVLRNV